MNDDQVVQVNDDNFIKSSIGIPVKADMVAGKLNMRTIKYLARRKDSKSLSRKALVSNGFQDPLKLAKSRSKDSVEKECLVSFPRASCSISPKFTREIGIQSGFIWPTSEGTCEVKVVKSVASSEEGGFKCRSGLDTIPCD
ncbi:hypothetical protein L6452_39243 [Arctium lappa]|uniref:Uncharacterized protein n=1 Tax=Arctium lappa TaxID=4217 RepID=A0ACB8XVV7_ARCLA|nr:hypothetical protein L6452_39243 [Arctium lappa]